MLDATPVFWMGRAGIESERGETMAEPEGRSAPDMTKGSGSVLGLVTVALEAVSLLTPLTVVELLCDGLAVALANACGVPRIATSPPLGPSPLYGSA
jgi:hypothetical protein